LAQLNKSIAAILIGLLLSSTVFAEETPQRSHLAAELQLAENGDASAQVALGDLYRIGAEVPQNIIEAAKWYRRAAEQGDTVGLSRLGLPPGKASPQEISQRVERMVKTYAEDDAKKKELWPKYHKLTKNEVSDLNSYLELAAQGDVRAQVKVGDLYRLHEISRMEFAFVDCFGPCPALPKPEYSDKLRDNGEALKWYRMAAEKSDPEAQRKMGDFYAEQARIRNYPGSFWPDMILHGEFDNQDNFAQAAGWYEKAAEGGDITAMDVLSAMYNRGEGVQKNAERAKEWHDRAKSKRQ
jgi:TPR repeat protein